MSKKLSIFIDESGDFGPLKPYAPYYLITMILHNQDIDISENIKSLENHLHNLNFDYKLFQVADLLCSLELLSLKAEAKVFSKSKTDFFGTTRDFKKNYLKPLLKKKL